MKLSLLKDLSADATDAGIVNRILKLTQTFGNKSPSLYSVNKFSRSNGFFCAFPKFVLCTDCKCFISFTKSSLQRSSGYCFDNDEAFCSK